MRRFRLTTQEFIAALKRAESDDARWPFLCSAQWLLNHSKSRDGEVVLTISEENAPRPPLGH